MVYDIENMSSFPEGDPKYIQLPPRFAFRDLPGGVSQLHSDATSGGRVTRILGFGWWVWNQKILVPFETAKKFLSSGLWSSHVFCDDMPSWFNKFDSDVHFWWDDHTIPHPMLMDGAPRKLEAKLSRTRKAKAEGKFGNSEASNAWNPLVNSKTAAKKEKCTLHTLRKNGSSM